MGLLVVNHAACEMRPEASGYPCRLAQDDDDDDGAATATF